jgi:3-hydroxy-9,10-secoandrosta-1,3,5(10)-triene-9,17-dione monooxygenase
MLDDWGGGAQLGMQSSGSQGVKVENVLVPEHWVFRGGLNARPGPTAGTALHGNPMFLGVNGSFYHAALVAPQVGAVRAALDEYEHIVRTTPNRFPPPELQYQSSWYQQAYGLALAQCDAAEMILVRAGDMYTEYCERWARTGQPFSLEEDTRLHAALQQAGKLAWHALEALWTASPADAAKRHSRLARYYRDVSMYRLHASARPLFLGPQLAAVHFGLSNTVMPAGPG